MENENMSKELVNELLKMENGYVRASNRSARKPPISSFQAFINNVGENNSSYFKFSTIDVDATIDEEDNGSQTELLLDEITENKTNIRAKNTLTTGSFIGMSAIGLLLRQKMPPKLKVR